MYSELFCPAFSRIGIEYGKIWSISRYSVQMRENVDQINSEYGQLLRSDKLDIWFLQNGHIKLKPFDDIIIFETRCYFFMFLLQFSKNCVIYLISFDIKLTLSIIALANILFLGSTSSN